MSWVKAYVQYDWIASEVCNNHSVTVDTFNPDMYQDASDFLAELEKNGVQNNATWHLEAKGDKPEQRSYDAIRNTRQIREADVVITRLMRQSPTTRHWGSLACISYAIALGKPCYVIAANDCVFWQRFMAHHPLVIHCSSTEDMLQKISGKK